MGALATRLAERIRSAGPIGLADFMAAALGDPVDGYYMRQDPLGVAGDFVTAPEISQMFGEMIGAWFIDSWHRMGAPAPFALVELGPGRGTLMADALRIASLDPAFAAALRLHLVEASPVLRDVQRRTLANVDATWHAVVAGLPALPLIVVANEFVDALPIRQFVNAPEGWRERLVGLAPADDEDSTSPRFRFELSPPLDPATAPQRPDAPAGVIVETCPHGCNLAATLARRVGAQGGYALIVDYGYARGYGDTLQAVRGHCFADVLSEPGQVDLTAHVDFTALAAAARGGGAAVYGVVGQRDFLRALGIETRAAALKENASAAQRADIDAALRRLIGRAEMGTLFKAMAIANANLPVPAGFAG
jgi:NADH dehydrogenase [ubiquinone] 1 alpha subcomplex assembly factor 7